MSETRPSDPTAAVQPQTDSTDTPPPPAPQELPQSPVTERAFAAAGKSWIARLAGKGACGTGSYGLGLVEAVHFYQADTPDQPVYEALLARGRFAHLFDRELGELLARATPIVLPEDR